MGSETVSSLCPGRTPACTTQQADLDPQPLRVCIWHESSLCKLGRKPENVGHQSKLVTHAPYVLNKIDSHLVLMCRLEVFMSKAQSDMYLLSLASFLHSTHYHPNVIAITDLCKPQGPCRFIWCQSQPADSNFSPGLRSVERTTCTMCSQAPLHAAC